MSLEASSSVNSPEGKEVPSSSIPPLIETNVESPIKSIEIKGMSNGQIKSTVITSVAEDNVDESNETTFDGYTAIQEANSSESREDELEKMRAMRMKNRIKSSDLESLF
jgi:hypothetical protein